jgi:hypothetical protein
MMKTEVVMAYFKGFQDCTENLRKIMKPLFQDSRPSREPNPVPPKYDAGEVTRMPKL